MSFRVFHIPAYGDPAAEAELNGFLNGHKILSVKRQLIDQGDASFWTFCVDYLEGGARPEGRREKSGSSRTRVDDRDVLSEEDFALYARLRDLRKELADAEGIQLYNVCTNEHLAKMVTCKAGSKQDLLKIDGLGANRVEKFGSRFLGVLKNATDGDGGGEKSEPAV